MTTAELAQLIGRNGLLATNGLQVAITITDVKQAYGRTRYTVTPLMGVGVATVEDFRVEVTP